VFNKKMKSLKKLKQNFLITSLFFGILLDSRHFLNLYIKLYKYIYKNKLEKDIIITDIHNLHLTLFYLQKKFIYNKKKNDILLLKKIDEGMKNIKSNVRSYNYFYNNQHETICFLECKNNNLLIKINKLLCSKLSLYSSQDNEHNFIPHITLFKIKNYSKFKRHKNHIELLINNSIGEIQHENVYKSTNIFLVNSFIEPELQIPLKISDLDRV